MMPFRLRQKILPWLVLAFSLATTFVLWQHEREIALRDLRNSFDFQVRETTARIEQRMAAYAQQLRGIQGLFAASDHVSQHDFQAYVDALQLGSDFYGIQGIGIAIAVPEANKASHIAGLRRQQYPTYNIIPGGDRPLYTPIVQLEPASVRNLQVIGFDPYTDPERRQAMERARDSGNSALTGKMQHSDASLLMYFPLYRKNQPHDSLEERRANLVGWAFAQLRLKELMASLYGEGTMSADLRIYDSVEQNESSLLFDAGKNRGSRDKALIESTEYIETAGRTWALSMRSQPSLEARYSNNKSQLIAIAGVGISLLLSILSWQLLAGRRRAMALAREMTSELRESEARWKYALEGAGDGVWDWDISRDQLNLSTHMQSMIDLHPEQHPLSLDDFNQRIHSDDLNQQKTCLQSCLTGQSQTYANEFRIQRNNGDWKWVLSRGKVIERSPQGEPLRMIGTLSDIAARKRMEEELRQLSITDTLTGLPNRRYFLSRLDGEISRLQRLKEQRLAVLMLDLDHFKWINDQFGHATGDAVLQHFAMMIRNETRQIDTIGRMGGEEFALLLPGADSNAALAFAERLRIKTTQIPFIREGKVIPVTVSIGVAVADSQETAINILARADKALYLAKESGRNKVCFDPGAVAQTGSSDSEIAQQQEDSRA